MAEPQRYLRRMRQTLWMMFIFLAGFTILLSVVSDVILLPNLRLLESSTPEQKHRIAANSALLLAVMLCILVIGLLMIFRIRRFFTIDRDAVKAEPTKHVDAWKEAGRRV